MIKKMRIQSVELTPENIEGSGGADFTRDGELGTDSSDSQLKVRLNSSTKTVVTKDQTQVLTNKTIDADLNSIVDLQVGSLKAGVLNTSTALSGASDAQIPSALAVKTYVDNKAAAQNEASEIILAPVGTISATNVQAGVAELDSDIQGHINNATGAHVASAISNIPSGNLAATQVQAALNELQSDIDTRATSSSLTTHINDVANPHAVTKAQVGLANVDNTSDATKNTATATLTNKTLTSPIINSPTGIVKADVGLSNVDNTSDATKNSAAVTLTNKTLTSPVINTPTGLVKADVGLGNVDNTSDATKNAAAVTLTNKTITGASIQTPTRLDVKQDTKANLTTYALTATNGQIVFATDTKEYFAIKDTLLSDLGGGGGIASVDILSAETADKAALTDFTQTGLEILDTPIVLHGVKSFRLQHATSIKSFKKVIAVDRKFRGKNNTISLDVASTATNTNLNIIFRDETNSVDLTTSQVIATGSQAITATTANASNQLTGMTNAVLNSLKIGIIITGSAIPVGTTITAISSTAATMSQNATGISSGIRISDLTAKKSFSVNIPTNCLSFSWAISSVVEAAAESYIDDIVVQLTSVALSSTSVTVPKNNDTAMVAWTPIFVNGGTPSAVDVKWERRGDMLKAIGTITLNATTALTMSLPSGLTIDSTKVSSTNYQTVGTGSISSNGSYTLHILAQGGLSAVSFGLSPTIGNTPYVGWAGAEKLQFNFEVPIQGWSANETESVTIPITSAQLVQQPDSALRVDNGSAAASFGSTATGVRRFTTIRENLGSAVQFLDDSILGSRFVIQEAGVFDMSFTDANASAGYPAITKNASSLTTNTYSLPADQVLAVSRQSGAGEQMSCAATAYLNVGDIIRAQINPSTNGVASQISSFSITKQGSLKQVNPSSDSKIEIPTHQLRFEGASSRGSTDTAIVKFNTQAITQGDAWSVVNTAANGTVITMNKAGKLSVNANCYISTTGRTSITKNQAILTTFGAASEVMADSYGSGIINSPAATFLVKIGDKIRVCSDAGTLTADASNSLTLVLEETSIPANFSNVLPQWSQSDSSVQLRTANGYGSANNKIRRFSNTLNNLGSAITYIDDAVNGASFTVNEDGEYNISYTELLTSASYFGITKNTTEPTIPVSGVTVPAALLSVGNAFAPNAASSCSWQGYLLKGDIIRAHTDGSTAGVSGTLEAKFSINKVGKPNLSSVDVTSFVNMKTTDTQSSFLSSTTGFTANITGSLSSNTNNGIYNYNSSTGVYTLLKSATVVMNASLNGTVAVFTQIYKNSTMISAAYSVNSAGYYVNNSVSFQGIAGDTFYVTIASGTTTSNLVSVLATADNNATASPTQQVSSDTISFAFKATAIDSNNDAIGTFNTYTYAASSNTAVISASAPTQTVSNMNTNGVQLFARAFTAASTTALPARVDIFIGKGLKSNQIASYVSAAKTTAISIDLSVSTLNADERGTRVLYNETTGILTLDAGLASYSANTSRTIGIDIFGNTAPTSGYFVFNASKSPSLVTIPNLAPRIATVNETQVSTVSGGTPVASTWTARTLNTIQDSTGIITSLASNTIVLPAGTYQVNFSSPMYNSGNCSARFRNISDNTTTISGSTIYNASGTNSAICIGSGQIVLTSPKSFQLQYFSNSPSAGGEGLGVTVSTASDNIVYGNVTIQKIK